MGAILWWKGNLHPSIAKIVGYNNYLISMGNYYFENNKKKLLKVEYTFGFIKINEKDLRINLHHSSLPYEN